MIESISDRLSPSLWIVAAEKRMPAKAMVVLAASDTAMKKV